MMTCPTPERLAAASAGEDEATAAHAAACAACRDELDATAAVIAAVRNVPAGPALSADRRASLRALVLASSDAPAAPVRSARWPWALAVAAAVLIAVGVAATLRGGASPAAQVDERASVTPPPRSEPRPAPHVLAPARLVLPAPPAPPAPNDAPAVAHNTAPHPHAPSRAVTALHDGATTFDTSDDAPVRVDVGGTRVVIAHAKVEITAHAGVISSVRVFGGSAEISQQGTHVVVSRGELWRAPDPDTGWRAFGAGWTLLRAEHYAEAIKAFDQARDPAVAEDAAYWAAVAAMRAGDHDDAAKRLRAFLAAFPSSARADDVRKALADLNP
jgi:hypothetical protein